MHAKLPFIAIAPGPATENTWEYAATIHPTSAFIQDHRVHQHRVVSGSCWLECIQQAFLHLNKSSWTMNNIIWVFPHIVDTGATMATISMKQIQQNIAVVVSSQKDSQELVHATATIQLDNAVPVRKSRLSIKAIQEKSVLTLASDEIYQRFSQLGFQYGPSYQLIKTAYCSSNACLSELIHLDDVNEFVLHPGVVDAALQSCLGISYVNHQIDKAHLPFSIKSIKSYSTLAKVRFIYAITNPVKSEGLCSYHLFLLDDQGEILVFINDFVGRQVGGFGE